MRDRIHIKNLRLRCYIGFAEHELREMQDVVISMWLYTDIRAAGESDDPADLLNYRTVNKTVINAVNGARYRTLEALATEIARLAIVECGVRKIRVAVYKPGALRFTDNVGVIITRRRKDFLPRGKKARKAAPRPPEGGDNA
ncbi:MAG: dihydroneopterin triphosphate 2'-epimerase [Anaerolineae bacterium]